MKIRKVNGTTFDVNGFKFGFKEGKVKLLPKGKKFVPVNEAIALLSKSDSRKLRKALFALGQFALAATKRIAA